MPSQIFGIFVDKIVGEGVGVGMQEHINMNLHTETQAEFAQPS